MNHDFEFRGAAEMPRPYDPVDYGLPIWRDEDHQPPETVEQEPQTAEIMSTEEAKCKLCSYALSQVGYHEGVNNWNKYAEIPEVEQLYGWKPQSTYWCDTFVDACFVACFGLELASKLTYQPVGSGSALCRTSADYYKEHGAFFQTPEIGDQVFFYASGDINHTGIVVRVDGGSVHTVEGNSSDMVAERVYSVSDSKIAGYGRPNWAVVEGKDIDVPTNDHIPDATKKVDEPRSYALRLPYLSRGSFGELVAAVQTLLILEGYQCGPDGADGDFGQNTETAVRKFQEQLGLTADGVVGPETGAALFDAEVYTPPKQETKAEAYEASSFWNNLLGLSSPRMMFLPHLQSAL